MIELNITGDGNSTCSMCGSTSYSCSPEDGNTTWLYPISDPRSSNSLYEISQVEVIIGIQYCSVSNISFFIGNFEGTKNIIIFDHFSKVGQFGWNEYRNGCRCDFCTFPGQSIKSAGTFPEESFSKIRIFAQGKLCLTSMKVSYSLSRIIFTGIKITNFSCSYSQRCDYWRNY